MNLLKIATFFAITICSFSVFSQEKEPVKKDSVLPKSIYSIPFLSTDLNSTFSINQRLNLTTYQFTKNIFENGFYEIPFYNITQSPREYIYGSFIRDYETSILQSAFFKVSDLYLPRENTNY